jgi:G:T-mismatch repair DNA endonuclease (very short patch repair protein)
MIVPNQKIKVKWHGSNRKHYENSGYVYTKQGEEFEVIPEHLPQKSHIKILITCDFCGEESEKELCGLNLNGNQFCSNSCAGKFKFTFDNPNPQKDKSIVSCNECGHKFEVFESVTKNNRWHFCSRECYANFRHNNMFGEEMYNYQNLKTKCIVCKKEFKTTKWEQEQDDKGKFCSQECYYKYRSIYYVGENHPMFGINKSEEEKENMRILTTKRIANGEFPQTNTTIHVAIKEMLHELNTNFKEEIGFEYYSLDFYDEYTNLGIEVMGDYWHGNPCKYKLYNDLNETQKKDVRRDKSKRSYLKKFHDINILYLWEIDIKKNADLCKKLIELFIKNNGIIKDYNSFNYLIVNGDLILDDKLIKPYFM